MAGVDRVKKELALRRATGMSAFDEEYASPLAFATEVVKKSQVPRPRQSQHEQQEAAAIAEFFKSDDPSSLVGFNKEMKQICLEQDTVLTLKKLDGIYQKLSYFIALRLLNVPNATIAVVTASAMDSAWLLTAVQERLFQMSRSHLLTDRDAPYLFQAKNKASGIDILHVQPAYEQTPIKKANRTLMTLSGEVDARGAKPNLLIVPDCSIMASPSFHSTMEQFLMLKDMRIVILDSPQKRIPELFRKSHDMVQLFRFIKEKWIDEQQESAVVAAAAAAASSSSAWKPLPLD
jgi:hypothetical protein